MKVVRLSALCTGRLVLIFVTGCVNLRATVWSEGFCQLKIPMSPLGMEPMTFQLVVHGLKKLHHHVPPPHYNVAINKYFNPQVSK